MAMSERSNYFGTFLETVQAKEEAETNGAPIALIHVLDERGPLAVTEIQTLLNVDILNLSKALETMSEAQLVQLSGRAGEETVSLTPQGQRLAELQSAFV
jgi:DNA-binding MarR family transcriptional regulator